MCGRRPDGAELAKVLRRTGKNELTQDRGSTDAFKTRIPPTKVMYQRFHLDQFYKSKKNEHCKEVESKP